MKKKGLFTVKEICEIAIFAAIAFALNALQDGLFRGVFANGGSIGLAMLPILIMCYRRGFAAGLLTSIVLTFLQLLGGVYAIGDAWYNVLLQVLLDYILAYPFVSFAGLFAKKFKAATENKEKIKWLVIGSVVGGLAKFLCHFLAGVLFWKNFDFKGGYVLYSLVYNGGYMLPNIILCTILLCVIQIKQPKFFIPNDKGEVAHEN